MYMCTYVHGICIKVYYVCMHACVYVYNCFYIEYNYDSSYSFLLIVRKCNYKMSPLNVIFYHL